MLDSRGGLLSRSSHMLFDSSSCRYILYERKKKKPPWRYGWHNFCFFLSLERKFVLPVDYLCVSPSRGAHTPRSALARLTADHQSHYFLRDFVQEFDQWHIEAIHYNTIILSLIIFYWMDIFRYFWHKSSLIFLDESIKLELLSYLAWLCNS